MILGMDTAGCYLEICKKYLGICKDQVKDICFTPGAKDMNGLLNYVNEMHDCAIIIEKIHGGQLTAEEIEKVETWEAATIEYTQKWVPEHWENNVTE